MNNLKNITRAFEAFIANATADFGPTPGITYEVQTLGDKIRVIMNLTEEFKCEFDPWDVLEGMPFHSDEGELEDNNFAHSGYVEYDFSDSVDPELRDGLLTDIADMAISTMNLPDMNAEFLDQFVEFVNDYGHVNHIVHGDLTSTEYLECLLSGNMDFWKDEWDEKTSRMHDYALIERGLA